MSLTWLLTNFAAAFLLPPLNLLLLGGVGLWLFRRRRRLAKTLIGVSLAGLWLFSTPLIANALLDSLKPDPLPLTGREADAIVILAGGRNRDSLEYGGDTLGRFSLERLRYGAWLAKRLRKPILVTGGMPDGGSRSEADILRDSLRNEFGLDARWAEVYSRNTRENARNSAEILRKAGIRRIYLVSHAWHLARAIPEFEAQDLQVVPAGTGYSLTAEISPLDFLPSARALDNSALAMHEWIGQIWYRIRN
jgi:uncharacterized SAM-binding protein YcdF (DUF218 family)